jgi:hypothetical protein
LGVAQLAAITPLLSRDIRVAGSKDALGQIRTRDNQAENSLMKVTNWVRKAAVKLVAAGVLLPSAAYAAIDLPLGDPSFEDYVLTPDYPTGAGYAYSDDYVSQSEWIDDLNGAGFPADYIQSDGISSWLYEVQYGEDGPPFRPAPRTGTQAMHGNADPVAGHYNAQITGHVFEANHTYTFSIYAQNDFGGDDTEGVFMYIFNGDEDFSDADSLARNGGAAFTAANGDFNDRLNGMSQQDSEGNWRQISISHYVAPGAPEIGSSIGVGFFLRDDSAVDDATLSVVPEPGTIMLAGLGGLALLPRRRRK